MVARIRQRLIAARTNAQAAIAEATLTANDPFVWALAYAAHHALEDVEPRIADIPEEYRGTYAKVRDEMRAVTAGLPSGFLGAPIFGTPAQHQVTLACRRVIAFVKLVL